MTQTRNDPADFGGSTIGAWRDVRPPRVDPAALADYVEEHRSRTRNRGRRRPDARGSGNGRRLARGLGWFSIGLGVAELVAPGQLARAIGLPGNERLLQVYGLREIAAGVAILAAEDPRPGIAARIAGDGLDLGTLVPAMSAGNPNRKGACIAAAAVLGVAAMDVTCARLLAAERHS